MRSEETFQEGLAALQRILDNEFFGIFRETNHAGCEAVKTAPITEKRCFFYKNLNNWIDQVTAFVGRAFVWIAKTPEMTLLGALAWCFIVVFFGVNLDHVFENIYGRSFHMSVGPGMAALIAFRRSG